MPAIGTAPCLGCGREIAIRVNANGAQNWSCPHCDLSAYAKKGTEAQRRLEAKIKRDPESAPPAPPAADPAPPAKPAKQKMPWER